MIFGKIFHLSKEGSKAIVQAGIWLALFNLAALLPVILLAMASEKMITLYYADSEAKISLLPYALALAVILAVMFVTYKVAYHKEYLTSGQEEYKLRMELADKLRRLPLSFLGMRDLSDVTGVIMDDVQTMSHVLSQTAAELIGGMITGIVSLLMLFVYDWRLALYLAHAAHKRAQASPFKRRIEAVFKNSAGGLDILGLYLSKKNPKFTVGRFCICFNVCLYTLCLFLFNATTAIYSAIYNILNNLFLDKLHQQNVNVEMLIFTKKNNPELVRAGKYTFCDVFS